MRAHACACPECQRLLSEFKLVRNVLGNLKDSSPRATYKLELSNCLQHAMRKPSRLRARSMALGITVVAALVFLLWSTQLYEVAERHASHRHIDLILEQAAYDEYVATSPRNADRLGDYPAFSPVLIQTVSD